MIDFRSRLKNKVFLITLFSLGLFALGVLLQPFGIKIPNEYLMNSANAVLAVLAFVGIIVDPTTPGIYDDTKKVITEEPLPPVPDVTVNSIVAKTTEQNNDPV